MGNNANKTIIIKSVPAIYEYLFFGFWITLIFYMGSVYVFENDGGLFVKGTSQWLDIPVHISYIKHFLNTPLSQWFAIHPLNVEQEFTYHFLADLISAAMFFLGVGIKWSLSLPVIIATIGFLREAYLYFKEETGNTRTSMLVVSSVFLFGGAGFLYRLMNPDFFIQNMYETSVFATEGQLAISAFPNILSGMLFAQRGLPFGLWFFFAALRGYKNIQAPVPQLVVLLILNALMMLALIHASMAFLIFLGLYFLYSPSKKLFTLGVLLFLESALIFYIFYTSALGGSFVALMPGFYFGFTKGFSSYLSFWVASTFALFPLIIFFYVKTKIINIRLVFAIIILFIINIIQFQPNPWDNVKLFVLVLPFFYEYIFSCLQKLNITKPVKSVGLTGVVFLLWATGAWDVYETTFTDRMDFELYTKSDVELAENLDQLLPQQSRVVLQNKHNHMAIQLLNKHPLLGFQFNLDTYGHNYRSLKDNINNAIEGNVDSKFVKDFTVSAIILSKVPLYNEREAVKIHVYIQNEDHVEPNISILRKNHEVLAENDRYIVFSAKALGNEQL